MNVMPFFAMVLIPPASVSGFFLAGEELAEEEATELN
jgi:hypothetical protein